MNISQNGINFIKKHESLITKVYKDIGGKEHIGYGHLIRPGEHFTTITPAEAEEILRKDLAWAEEAVNDNVKVPLTQNQYDTLVSVAFNVGPGGFKKFLAASKLNEGKYNNVPNVLKKWTGYTVIEDGKKVLKKNQGLYNRRLSEIELWGGSVASDTMVSSRKEDGYSSGDMLAGLSAPVTNVVEFLNRGIEEIERLLQSAASSQASNITIRKNAFTKILNKNK